MGGRKQETAGGTSIDSSGLQPTNEGVRLMRRVDDDYNGDDDDEPFPTVQRSMY